VRPLCSWYSAKSRTACFPKLIRSCRFASGVWPRKKSLFKLLEATCTVSHCTVSEAIASTKDVTWHCDVGCSEPVKASANWPKGSRTDHLAGRPVRICRHCSPVELDAMRVARPVRGRLLRVIPFPSLEGVIREFYPMAGVEVLEEGRRRNTSL